MEPYIMIKSGLVLHLAGITLMIGITIASLVVYLHSFELLSCKKDQAKMILEATARYPMLQS